MIGEHTVELFPDAGAGDAVDLSCLVDEVAIHHGRDDTDSQPEAASCTLSLILDTDLDPMPDVEMGAFLRVVTTVMGTGFTRFLGRVTDVAMGWDEAGTETPDRLTAQVVAVSTLADLGRRVVGDAPWPQELDGARVARIMAAAGITLDPAYSDPGTVQVLARDVDSQPALGIAQEVATDARGVLWHTRSGEIRYADSEHRRGAVPALELDACDVLVTPTWRRNTEGLINDVSVGYGPPPDEGEQPRYLAENAVSIGRFGRYEWTAGTQLALLADATALALLLVTRNAYPVWVLDALPVDLKGLDLDQTDALLSLDMHALVNLTGLPAAGSAPTTAALWVEGWTERLAFGEHDIELAVSGYCRTVPAPRWDDVPATTTWDTAPGTWDEATCMGPQPNLGRWADVPASTRWDRVPATTTWDNWK